MSAMESGRSIEVIAAGLPRTGTLSLTVAFKTLLEGPVMHGGSHVFGRGQDALGRDFVKAFELRRSGEKAATLSLLKRLFAGYVGVADVPPAAFIEELLELYPQAKVVLVRRDPQRWFESFSLLMQHYTALTGYLLAPLPGLRWSFTIGNHFVEWWTKIQGDGQSAPLGPELMDKHAEYIRKLVPEERLLEMDLSQGWEPLCEFLGKPVPKDVPFPRLNEAKTLVAWFRIARRAAILAWLGIFTTAGVAVYLGWRLWQSDYNLRLW